MQRWPVVPNADQTIPSTASSTSASSMTMIAFLPPSSRWTCLSRSAAAFVTATPVSREPVNVITGTSGWRTSASPASSPKPCTMLTTPGGTPASASSSTKRSARNGVSSAGFRTTVLPQTSAGQSFHDGIAIGKFHGVIAPTTPTGIRTLIMNLSGSSLGVVWPKRRRPSPPM